MNGSTNYYPLNITEFSAMFKAEKNNLVGPGLSYYACEKEEVRVLTRELSFQWVVPPMPTCVSATEEPLFLSRGAAGPSTPLTLMSPSVRSGMTCHADLQITKPGFNEQDGPREDQHHHFLFANTYTTLISS